MPKRLGSAEVIRVLDGTGFALPLRREAIVNIKTSADVSPSCRTRKRRFLLALRARSFVSLACHLRIPVFERAVPVFLFSACLSVKSPGG